MRSTEINNCRKQGLRTKGKRWWCSWDSECGGAAPLSLTLRLTGWHYKVSAWTLQKAPTLTLSSRRGGLTTHLGGSTVCLTLRLLAVATQGRTDGTSAAGGRCRVGSQRTVLSSLPSPSSFPHCLSLANQKPARCLESVVWRLPALASQGRNGGRGNGRGSKERTALKVSSGHDSLVPQDFSTNVHYY